MSTSFTQLLDFLRNITATALLMCFITPLFAQHTVDMPNAVETQVTGINDYWSICGFYTDTDGLTSGYCIILGDTFFYNHNNYNTWFGGINNNNKVVGRYNPSGNINDYHAFILNLNDTTIIEIPALDGYEYMSPNDINDLDAISGDLKNGANRRIFIYDQNGLNTQNYLIDGQPMPTYGGYGLDNLGRLSGWYLLNGDYISFRYHPDFGYMNIIDLNDPEFPNSHKTRLMGMNSNGQGVLDFIVSDNAYIYDFGNTSSWASAQKFIPGSTEIHLQDINSTNAVCGSYTDANYIVHGFADMYYRTNFQVTQHGNAFINDNNPVWPANLFPQYYYEYDHYFTDEDIYLFPDLIPGHIFQPTSYPSWPDFVSMLSPQSCYYNIPLIGNQFENYPIMRPIAFSSWKIHRSENFHGACFGMASNAAASWQFPDVIYNKFQTMLSLTEFGGWENIYAQGNLVINHANMSQAGQASQEYAAINAAASDIPADSIIKIITNAFMAGTEVPVIAATLIGNSLIAGHALFPYGIEPLDEINQYAILVYDPNDPGDENVTIKVRYDENTSHWTFLFGSLQTQELTYGMRLMYVRDLYNIELLPGMPEVRPSDNLSNEIMRDDEVRLFTLSPSSYNIAGTDGNITVSDDVYENTISGAEPVLNYGGLDIIPTQFILPTGEYTFTTTENDNQSFSGGMRHENTTIIYNRSNTQSGQEDILQASGTALTYLNNIGENTEVIAEVFTQNEDTEFSYEITDLSLQPDQSVTLQYTAPYLYISNSGAATEYDVTIQILDEVSGLFETLAANVNIENGITQEIIPVFDENGIIGISITESDDDPNTDDNTFTVENSGIPELVIGMDTLMVFPAGGANSLGVANFGGGLLEWNVLSAPEWIALAQSSGINYGTVDFTVEPNDEFTREGLLIVQNTSNANETDTLYIQQIGALGIVNDNNLSQHISLWPNPTNGLLQLKKASHLIGKQMNYEVISSDGKIVLTGNFNSDLLALEMSSLPSGLYQIRLNAKGTLITKRVILER